MTRIAKDLVAWAIYTILLAVTLACLPLIVAVCLLTDEDLFEKGR